jgi:eukaryotic-like serine/threonine-protein kinase
MPVTPRGERELDPELLRRLQEHVASTYTVESELGGGGMSRVFVAHERGLDRRVVIKVLPPSLAATVSADRFRREIMVSARLQHPQIVPVLTSGELDGLPYFVMPFIEGESLRGRIQRGPLSVREAVSIMRDVARALSFAHRFGVVHRDIKPDNILLSQGSAVVTDFGVAKAILEARTSEQVARGATITAVGVSLGTPQYMAPEQAAADPTADHRADLYALGIVGYEMLAGVPPFHGRAPTELLRAQLTETPPPLTARRYDIPVVLAQLISQCLEKNPSDRPKSAAEVIRVLERPEAVSGGFDAATRAERRVSPRMVMAICVALIVIVIAAVLLSNRAGAPVRASHRVTIDMVSFEAGGAQVDSGLPHDVFADLAGALRTVNGLAVVENSTGPESAAAGTAFLLRGALQRSGGRVRVNLRLTPVNADSTIWSGRFEGKETDILALEDQIATATIDGVKKRILGAK